MLVAPDENTAFVSLAGEQQGVTGLRLRDGVRDRLAPVFDRDIIRPTSPAHLLGTGGDLINHLARCLLARVLVGKDGIVRQPGGYLTHPRSFITVALTGTAEDGNQANAGHREDLTQYILKDLGRGYVFDHDALCL